MKKIIFFTPAIISLAFYGLVMIGTGLSVLPFVYLWIATFIISGILLSKGIFGGGCVGMLPGVHLIYTSTQEHGQILPFEMSLGIIVVLFYLLCCVFVWCKKKNFVMLTIHKLLLFFEKKENCSKWKNGTDRR